MSAEVASARPLAGRVILITRARQQAGRFATLLEEAGGQVLLVPTIVVEPPDSWAPLDLALARAGEFQWAVFTSVNGVEMVRRRLAASPRRRLCPLIRQIGTTRIRWDASRAATAAAASL